MDQETRQAFEAVDRRFTAIDKQFESVDRRFTEMEARFLERLEAMETKLLGAFFSWQSAVDQKLHEMPILQTRVGLLEERVTKLERKDLEGRR